MPNLHLDDKTATADAPTQDPKTGPSGSTDKTREREKKFDEEGGDQPQAPSESAVERELRKIHEEEGPQ
jgi:hypothetical protein